MGTLVLLRCLENKNQAFVLEFGNFYDPFIDGHLIPCLWVADVVGQDRRHVAPLVKVQRALLGMDFYSLLLISLAVSAFPMQISQ